MLVLWDQIAACYRGLGAKDKGNSTGMGFLLIIIIFKTGEDGKALGGGSMFLAWEDATNEATRKE